MGDARDKKELLEGEQYRLSTFGNKKFVASLDNSQLAEAGFFLSQGEGLVKCHVCHLQLKAGDIKPHCGNVVSLHKKKNPSCPFILKLSSKLNRRKAFTSILDSLRFENSRLDTFIDWPVTFISPAKLAEDGFYFMRHDDQCACIFCKGIIGAWEEGDTPRGEHKKHFPSVHLSTESLSAMFPWPRVLC